MSFQTPWSLWRAGIEYRPLACMRLSLWTSIPLQQKHSEITFLRLPQPQRKLWSLNQYSAEQENPQFVECARLFVSQVQATAELLIWTLMRMLILVSKDPRVRLHYVWKSGYESEVTTVGFNINCESTLVCYFLFNARKQKLFLTIYGVYHIH